MFDNTYIVSNLNIIKQYVLDNPIIIRNAMNPDIQSSYVTLPQHNMRIVIRQPFEGHHILLEYNLPNLYKVQHNLKHRVVLKDSSYNLIYKIYGNRILDNDHKDIEVTPTRETLVIDKLKGINSITQRDYNNLMDIYSLTRSLTDSLIQAQKLSR